MRGGIAILGVGIVLLTGCVDARPAGTSETTGTSSTTPEVNANVEACGRFIDVFEDFQRVGEARNAEEISVDEWTSLMGTAAAEYDAVALIAEGDVKARIEDLVDLIDSNPSGLRGMHSLSDDWDMYISLLQRIGDACTLEGVDMSFGTSDVG